MKAMKVMVFLALVLFSASAMAAKDELHDAVMANDAELVKELIANGADINSQHWMLSRTPLMLAAINGNLEITKILLDAGADYEIKSSGGCTAIYYAAEYGRNEVAKILYARGADPYRPTRRYGCAYFIAAYLKNAELTALWAPPQKIKKK